MAYLMVIFAVWLAWNLLQEMFTVPSWFQYLFAVGLGIGGMCLINRSNWWWGIGLAGAAGFLLSIGDVLLVTRDAIKANVLRRSGRR